jgi:PBP1b-binding outer membrane lipoprotein LpoB
MKPSTLLASLLSLALLGAGCSSPSTVAQERVNEMQNNVLNATSKAKSVMKTVNQNAQGEIDKFKNSASSVRGLLE